MRRSRSVLSRVGIVAVAVTAVTAGTAGATVNALTVAAPDGPVSSTPAAETPHLLASGALSQIRQLVQCGTTMYAVGTFTQIKRDSATYTRSGAFSFSATAPFKVTSWDPEVKGTVSTIAFNGTDCSNAYIGGKFTAVGSTTVKNIAEVSTTTSQALPTFKSSAAGGVDTIASSNGHLLVGGLFTGINGSTADPYFASLSPITGKDDGYAHLGVSGNYAYVDAAGRSSSSNATRVFNQQISHDGTRDLVEGDFTSIGGQPRRQIAMLDLGPSAVSTDAWYATEFNSDCNYNEPFYAQAAAWSPDDQTVYVGTTGYKPDSGPGYLTSDPRFGLCDAMAAFPSTAQEVQHLWINYTGCDSMYSAAADASTAYFGGHERWSSNSVGCDHVAAGAIATPGMVGLSPVDGSVTFNPTRARGLGADDMLVTNGGLWTASDNQGAADQCGGVSGHSGICFLPYPASS